nr:MAG TPA: hypothetical protein [Caudoviricetes sp.]
MSKEEQIGEIVIKLFKVKGGYQSTIKSDAMELDINGIRTFIKTLRVVEKKLARHVVQQAVDEMSKEDVDNLLDLDD